MGLDVVDTYLRALRQGTEKKQAADRLKLEQQKADMEYNAKKDEMDFHHQQLDQAQKQFEANHKLVAAEAAARMVEAKQKIAEGIMNGVPVAGDVESPAAQTPSGAGYTSANPAQATSVMHTIPLGEGMIPMQLQLPTREAAAQKQANISEILKKPEVDAKIKEELALQAERFKQTEASKQADYIRTEASKKADAERNRETLANQMNMKQLEIKGEMSRAVLQRQTQMDVAKLPYTFFLNQLGPNAQNATPDQKYGVLQPYINALDNGTMSMKDLKEDFAAKGMQGGEQAILGIAMKNGIIPPTEDQKKTIVAMQPITQLVKKMDELIQALPKTVGTNAISSVKAGVKSIGTIGDSNINALYKELESQIATVAKGVSGDAGQRLQKAMLDSAHGGYMPNRMVPTAANVKVRNNFVKELNDIVDAQLASKPPDQRQRIKNNMGLSAIPLMSTDGSYIGQPSPNSESGGFSPAALQLMQKHGIN